MPLSLSLTCLFNLFNSSINCLLVDGQMEHLKGSKQPSLVNQITFLLSSSNFRQFRHHLVACWVKGDRRLYRIGSTTHSLSFIMIWIHKDPLYKVIAICDCYWLPFLAMQHERSHSFVAHSYRYYIYQGTVASSDLT